MFALLTCVYLIYGQPWSTMKIFPSFPTANAPGEFKPLLFESAITVWDGLGVLLCPHTKGAANSRTHNASGNSPA